jgi:hypothetical protein
MMNSYEFWEATIVSLGPDHLDLHGASLLIYDLVLGFLAVMKEL